MTLDVTLDPRTPVLVGSGQFLHRAKGLDDALDAVAIRWAAEHQVVLVLKGAATLVTELGDITRFDTHGN